MKKKILCTLLAVAIAICVMAGILIYKNYDWLYTRCYAGNRIEGTYSITVEGEELEVTGFEYNLDGESVDYKYNEDMFSIKKGYYGLHIIRFTIDNKVLYEKTGDEYFNNDSETMVGIDYFNTNWWHIIKLDVKLNLVNKSGEWFVEQEVKDNLYPFTGKWHKWDCEDVRLEEFIQLGP